MTAFNPMVPELTVSDIGRTKDFYLRVLGFTLEYERPEDRFAFLSFAGTQMMFEQYHDDGWNVAPLRHPYGNGVNFSITCPDVRALYARVTAQGAPVFRALREARYRCGREEICEVQFLIQDPDGYLLRFTD